MREKIDCAQFEELLNAYLDNELDMETREGIAVHAKNCPDCGAKLETSTRLLTMLAEMDEGLTIPLDAQAAWRNAVRAEASARTQKRRGGGWMRAFGAVAAVLAVAVCGTALTRSPAPLSLSNTPRSEILQATAYNSDASSSGGSGVSEGALRAYGSRSAQSQKLLLENDSAADGMMVESRTVTPDAVSGTEDTVDESGSIDSAKQRGVMVIRTASREIQTSSFDTHLANINDLVSEYEGFFASKSVTGQALSESGDGRQASIVVRVPQDDLDAFLTALDALGTPVSRSESAEDVSDQYYDVDIRLTSYRTQLERLNELVKSTASLEELVMLEDKIYEVQSQIDSLEGTLRDLESQVNYSTVTIQLDEVAERGSVKPIAAASLKERIQTGFYDSVNWLSLFLQDMAVFLVSVAPVLVVALPVIIVIWIVVHCARKRKRKKQSRG